ncbi:hypothetical protein [Leptospira kmetyi]|uniref:hypothetical protein n=1 Tax=Leptospira kmetyi TaxID=408139 RepID=UPI00108459D4|nr:hypothetical protein [Leptospira kmetyi]TGL68341.1 hypothetical protein EHQ67_14265 [Leptospira kmetyi]
MNEKHPRFTIIPPWIVYPESSPSWIGWRQGESENWLLKVWLPFWKELDSEERNLYMENWPPPSKDWKLYITHYWK